MRVQVACLCNVSQEKSEILISPQAQQLVEERRGFNPGKDYTGSHGHKKVPLLEKFHGNNIVALSS